MPPHEDGGPLAVELEPTVAADHRPLLTNGLERVAEGATTLEELRILGSFSVPPRETAAEEALVEQAKAVDCE